MSEQTAERILVIANRSCPCPALLDEVAARGTGAEVLLVAPALNSKLKHWGSDVDDSIEGAQKRLEEATEGLRERGVEARGEVGDSHPLQAIDDALAVFRADQIMIGTFPVEDSHWLEDDLIADARKRFTQPVAHIESRYGLPVDR